MKKFPTRFRGYYVTEDGKVYRNPITRVNTNDLIEVGQHSRGGTDPKDRYMAVNISLKDENGKTLKQIHYYTHKLIAETLILNTKDLPEVDHIDNDKKNNTVSNLRWITRKENWICPERHSNGQWIKSSQATSI